MSLPGALGTIPGTSDTVTIMLDREEYIEQTHFFRVYRERIEENIPAQEILAVVRDEILTTTKLPMAIDFLAGELSLRGRVSEGMKRLAHYFTPFQTFIMSKAEEEGARFDIRIAVSILEQLAEYMSGSPTVQGLFMYQFECLARNRLGYDFGMEAVSRDPFYSPEWKDWILKIRPQLGMTDFAEMLYVRSQHRVLDVRRQQNDPHYTPGYPILFEAHEGRIAKANVGKDPLYMFAALQRQLGYPRVPRPKPSRTSALFEPQVEQRFQRLEARLGLLEQEAKGGIDLQQLAPKDLFRVD